MVDVTDLLHYDPPCPDAELIPLESDPPSISMAPISTFVPPPFVESTPPSGADDDAEELARYTADLEPAVRDLIREYHGVFPSSFSYAGIPPMRDVEHSIQLVPNYRVHNQAPYRLSIPEATELKRQLEELLRLGFIKPSNSPWGAPVLFARKADGTLRLCIDYRGLNRYTVKNSYPMPRPNELFDRLAGNRFFTKIDLRSGYHQIRVAAADQPKTAFRSRFGHYEFTVMPFGLTNAPATFQRSMNDIFRDILEQYVLIYLHDILVYSRTLEEHLRHLHDVLDHLRRYGFYAKLRKCRFAQHKVDFLGHYVSDQGLHMDDAKITAIADRDDDLNLMTRFAIAAEILTSQVIKLEVVVSCVMSSLGSGRDKSAANLAVEADAREKKGCHIANKKRKLVQGSSSLARYVEDEQWVSEGVASQVESDFEEEEEVSLKRKSSRRGSGGPRIEDGGGTAIAQQNRAPVPHVNDDQAAQEGVVLARTPATPRATTATDIGMNAQAIAQANKSRSPALEVRGAASGRGEGKQNHSGGAAQVGEGARAGSGAVAGASHAAEVVRAAGVKAGRGPHAGEGARAGDVVGPREGDEALVNRVRHRYMRDGIEAASKLWVDDLHFKNETEGNDIVKLIQEARLYLVAVAQGVQPPAVRRSIVLPHTTILQHKIDDESELNSAKERAFKVQTIALRVIHGWVFKSTSRQRGYHAAYGYVLNHAATYIARVIWMGEDWRICVSPTVFHITLDIDTKLPPWFVGTDIEDRHENDELAAYQEASIQRRVGAFTSAVSMAEGIDDGRVSHERLKSIADAMRIMLATTMWLMRMSGDDHPAHYEVWVFVQLTTKSTLIASMNRSFDARRHIVQAATVITYKLAKPPMTLVAPSLYIPVWASIGVKFSHDATLSSPMEAKKLDWLGTGRPEDEDDDKADDERSGGG
uniref:Reverse transcriptase domain-containing protein n=1 Tax=Chara braunii TaxID=69332 RepID=A0A388LB16_CHABU